MASHGLLADDQRVGDGLVRLPRIDTTVERSIRHVLSLRRPDIRSPYAYAPLALPFSWSRRPGRVEHWPRLHGHVRFLRHERRRALDPHDPSRARPRHQLL